MIAARHHVDAIVAYSEVFLLAFLVVIMANAKPVGRIDLEIIHLFVIRLARQVIHLVFVRRISTPVAAGGKRLADDQPLGRPPIDEAKAPPRPMRYPGPPS